MNIIKYDDKYEDSWVRCRTLSFLYTDYYDDILQNKPSIEGIELICVENHQIIGLIDIEIKNSNCSYDSNKRGAMIETIAVHPDYQRRGIAKALLGESIKLLEKMKIDYLECWTREDKASNGWYQKNGFKGFNEYYHVFTDKNIYSKDDNIKPIYSFCHFYGDAEINKNDYDRVYQCKGYVLEI